MVLHGNQPVNFQISIMKNFIKNGRFFLALAFVVALVQPMGANAQTSYKTKTGTITIKGTSNVHDWEMKAASGQSEASFIMDATGKITAITSLSFTIPAKSLKSQHTGMDNNTYKALKVTNNPNLSFKLTSGTIKPTTANNYLINCQGNLTIAGKTKQTEILATGIYNPKDKSFIVSGVKNMKMTDYDVAPPKALLGTIKTGNEISVGYTLKFTK